jgi:uncharacterized Zn-binding protein involved in type VI secretion
MRTALLSLLCIITLPASAQERPGTPAVVTGGSPDVKIEGNSAARQGDPTSGGNIVVDGSKDVFINGKPAALQGSKTSCGGAVVGGHGSVFINGKPVARTGDPAAGCPHE